MWYYLKMKDTLLLIIFVIIGIAALIFLRVFGVIVDGILAAIFMSIAGSGSRTYKRF